MKKATFFLTLCLALFCWTGIASAQITQGVVSRDGWSLSSPAAPSSAIEGTGDGRIAAAIDGNESTYYHSDWTGNNVGSSLPQYFIIDTGESGVSGINGFVYLPRPENGNGTSTQMDIYFSDTEFDLPGSLTKEALTAKYTRAAEATFTYNGSNREYKRCYFDAAQSGRYVLVVSYASKSGSYFTCAEFYLTNDGMAVEKELAYKELDKFKDYSSLRVLGFTEDYYTKAKTAIGAVTSSEDYATVIPSLATTAVNNIKRVLTTGTHIVSFINQDLDNRETGAESNRTGMKITAQSPVGATNSKAFGTKNNTGDETKWTLKFNNDGTFKLYNVAWNVCLGAAGSNAPLTEGSTSGVNYSFVVTDAANGVFKLKDANGGILHQTNNGNFGYMNYDNNDDASWWKMEAATLSASVNERMWNDLNALYTTEKNRAHSYYQANYGLVKSGDDIAVVVNHASGGDNQPSSNLLDGNASTYVHSSYGSDAGSDPHYIQVTLSEAKDKVMFYMHRRENSSNNNRPKTIKVYTSTDGTNFSAEPVATLDNLEGRSSVASYYSPEIDLGGSYQYLRFVVTATNTGTQFFTASEFYVLPINEETTKLLSIVNVTPANIKGTLISLVGSQPISSLSELSSAKVYTIAPEEYSTRGVLYAPAGASQLTSCGGSAGNAANQGVAVDIHSPAQQFAFVQANEKYYLYSVSEKKFVTNNSSKAKINYTPADYVTVEAADKEDHFIIKFNGSNFLNIANGYGDDGAAVTGWNNIDGGNRMRISPVGEFTPDGLSDFIIACQELKAALSGVKSGELIGSGLGQYTASVADYATISNTAHSFYNSITNETLVADITTQKDAVTPLASATTTLNMPTAGKLYRFKGTTSSKYMVSTLSETGGKTNQLGMNAANNTRESVFYYDGTNLVAYANGLCVGAFATNNTNSWQCVPVGGTAGAVSFGEGHTEGTYYIRMGSDRNLYDGTTYVDCGTTSAGNNYRWTIEEVAYLPVAVSKTVQYGTLYAPVDLVIRDGVEAYTAKVNGSYLTLKPVEGGKIPAHTAVILKDNGAERDENTQCIYLQVTSGATAISGNDLVGTYKTIATNTAATSQQSIYTLQNNPSEGIGFYKYTGENLGGFKAYLLLGSSQANGLSFDFGAATGLDNVATELPADAPAYDLAGRRVNKNTKGIIIVGNKKVINL